MGIENILVNEKPRTFNKADAKLVIGLGKMENVRFISNCPLNIIH